VGRRGCAPPAPAALRCLQAGGQFLDTLAQELLLRGCCFLWLSQLASEELARCGQGSLFLWPGLLGMPGQQAALWAGWAAMMVLALPMAQAAAQPGQMFVRLHAMRQGKGPQLPLSERRCRCRCCCCCCWRADACSAPPSPPRARLRRAAQPTPALQPSSCATRCAAPTGRWRRGGWTWATTPSPTRSWRCAQQPAAWRALWQRRAVCCADPPALHASAAEARRSTRCSGRRGGSRCPCRAVQ
jgi:hypothetical protein